MKNSTGSGWAVRSRGRPNIRSSFGYGVGVGWPITPSSPTVQLWRDICRCRSPQLEGRRVCGTTARRRRRGTAACGRAIRRATIDACPCGSRMSQPTPSCSRAEPEPFFCRSHTPKSHEESRTTVTSPIARSIGCTAHSRTSTSPSTERPRKPRSWHGTSARRIAPCPARTMRASNCGLPRRSTTQRCT